MLPASNRGVGTTIGFPDVCLTPAPPGPPIPVPYPNIGMTAQAAPFSPTVKVSGINALNLASKIVLTSGDEPGVAHPTIKGPASFTMGSPLVMIDGLPGITLTCTTMGNNGNNPVGMVAVPSISTVMFCRASDEAPTARADALAEAMERSDDVGPARVIDGAVVVPVRGFTPATRTRLYQQLRANAASPVILDLRGNAGGDRDGMLRCASDFVPPGTILLREHEPDGDVRVHRARGPRRYTGSLSLLVDRHTASAAELFAATLQWHGRAVVVGEPTYGKATVHAVRRGGAYPVVGRCTMPDGRELGPDDGGIAPTVRCPAEGALDAALGLLARALAP